MKKGKMISEKGFNQTVKFIEDSVKRANETKSQYDYIKYTKDNIDRAKKSIETCKKNIGKGKLKFDYDYESDYKTNSIYNVNSTVDTGDSYANLYAAKLSLQQAQLNLQIGTIGLKNALYVDRTVTKLAFALILRYRAMCFAINKGYVNPSNNDVSFKKKDREDNLQKFNYSR